MGIEIVTVALLTPVLLAAAGDYAFPLIAVHAENTSEITIQGVPVLLDEQGNGLGTAVIPVEEGRRDYVVTVQHGLIEQEVPVIVIGKRRPTVAWQLLFAPLAALLLSVRVRAI